MIGNFPRQKFELNTQIHEFSSVYILWAYLHDPTFHSCDEQQWTQSKELGIFSVVQGIP